MSQGVRIPAVSEDQPVALARTQLAPGLLVNRVIHHSELDTPGFLRKSELSGATMNSNWR